MTFSEVTIGRAHDARPISKNMKPETGNQKPHKRPMSLPSVSFWFLVSGFWFLPFGCMTFNPYSQTTSAEATVIPNVPVQKWGVETCGAGSLSTVMQHYGDTTTLRDLDATLPKMRGGVLTVDMLLAARKHGFDAQLVTGTPELVTREVADGRPVILMLQVIDSPGHKLDFYHYVVIDGLDPQRGLIRTQWGDQHGRWTTFAKIEKPWAGGGHAAIFVRPHDNATDAIRTAVLLEDSGDTVGAAKKYREILTAHSDSVLGWTNLGNADAKLGKREEAETDFRKAIELDPHARDAMNNLA